MNSVKETDVENRTYYFLNDVINIKYLDPNKIKIDEQSHKNIFIYHTGYLSYTANNSANFLYVTINKMNGYI